MIYLYIVILAVYVLLFILSVREKGKDPFGKMAAYILRKQKIMSQKAAGGRQSWTKDLSRRQLEEKLKTLQPVKPASVQLDEYRMSQYRMLLTVVFAGVVICLAVWCSAHSSPLLQEGGYIRRNAYGQGDIPIELAAQIDGEEEEIFEYVVEEQKYTGEEAEAMYQEAVNKLPEVIRGQNDSLEDVRYDLNLVTQMDGYPFTLSWESGSYAIVSTDGTVNNEDLEEGAVVALTACFQYEKQSWEHQLYVQVNPVVYTRREMLRNRIEELLHAQDERTESSDVMVLPGNIESESIVWREIVEDSSGYLLLVILLAAGCMYLGSGRDLDRRLEHRKRELLLDYPEIVNKLALYMGAGMTVRNSFIKMGEDYRKQQKERRRYVYEEILITCNELQSGRSENEAYDHFGKRCQLPAYMKLSTLLSQNIRKGSNDLLNMLRREADNAFAERKSLAKKLGEEAGTKLLLPMMLLLCIVMVIIMIPAYFSFTA